MVRVLCYGHKSCKFKSYARFVYTIFFLMQGHVVDGFTFWLQIENIRFNSYVSLLCIQETVLLSWGVENCLYPSEYSLDKQV